MGCFFLSKLVLGTAQFGLDYGINNPKGKISSNEVFKIINFAKENGILFLDTASVYGDSEQVIGEYIKDNNVNLQIITKIKNIKELDNSLRRLNLDEIYGCLLHNFNDLK